MKRKNKLMLLLLCIGVILTVVMMAIREGQEQRDKAYARTQYDATTSDLDFIMPYKNPYMGNASNIINLFYRLPLGKNEMKFHLLSDKLTVEVTYACTMQQAGKTNLESITKDAKLVKDMTENDCMLEVKKSLIYNSTAAFTLIDNLNYIEYVFLNDKYKVSRADVEGIYTNFKDIRTSNHWEEQVQKPLEKSEYINDIANQILKVQ